MRRLLDILFPILVGCMLVLFLAYSAAQMFGLDALAPSLFEEGDALGWVLLVALMLIGGLYWRGFWIKSQKRRGRERD